MDISSGLVTNGTVELSPKDGAYITWCRISCSDEREPDWDTISRNVQRNPNIDWAFSYVVSGKPEFDRIGKVVQFANGHDFTHVRIVTDILNPWPGAERLGEIRIRLVKGGISQDNVIYQPRTSFTMGAGRCLISLLKPVVGADGGIYPCCGTQYAEPTPARDYCEGMRMGQAPQDIQKIWGAGRHYDGSGCVRCYYEEYNKLLDMLIRPVEHGEFV
jgi:hypothetical protein